MATAEAQAFDTLLEPVLETVRDYSYIESATNTPGFAPIRELPRDAQARLVLHCLSRTPALRAAADEIPTSGSFSDHRWAEKNRRLYRWWAAVSCASSLLKKKLPWSDAELERVVALYAVPGATSFGCRNLSGLVVQLEANLERVRANPKMPGLIASVLGQRPCHQDPDYRRVVARLTRVLGADVTERLKPGEAWADKAIADLAHMALEHRSTWDELLTLAAAAMAAEP
ncbi:MAG TPA: hypothetical protein VFF69_09805, partial [Phycisphaerales bacterium]|nr:hypothetical protein [Phycisphaerales bacterium]